MSGYLTRVKSVRGRRRESVCSRYYKGVAMSVGGAEGQWDT